VTADLAQIIEAQLLATKAWVAGVFFGVPEDAHREHREAVASAVAAAVVRAGWGPVAETRQRIAAVLALCDRAERESAEWTAEHGQYDSPCVEPDDLRAALSDSPVSAVRSAGGRGREGTR
jgi:hypothetical protein